MGWDIHVYEHNHSAYILDETPTYMNTITMPIYGMRHPRIWTQSHCLYMGWDTHVYEHNHSAYI